MKPKLLLLNHSVLFLCTSMYLGTGGSLIFFSFPIAPQLTVENYYLQFVPQVEAATHFFTYMTMVMIAACGVMMWAEWKTSYRWVPVTVLLAVLAATGLTMAFIFPYNDTMKNGITDPAVLHQTLDRWMFLNKIRVGFWAIQWLCMMVYFASKAGAEGDRG